MNPEQWGIDGGARNPPMQAATSTRSASRCIAGSRARLPYGEIEPYQRAPFRRDPVAPSRRRPDVPIWLDHIVLQGRRARSARQRFETGEELLLALERGASRPLTAPLPTPLVHARPCALWKLALRRVACSLNALLVVWLAVAAQLTRRFASRLGPSAARLSPPRCASSGSA